MAGFDSAKKKTTEDFAPATRSVNPNGTSISAVDVYKQGLTGADRGLSDDAQTALAQQKYNWATANAKGDTAGMDAAHRNAEKIRWDNGGYYAGRSGTDHFTADDVYMSAADQNYLSADEQKSSAQIKAAIKAGLIPTEQGNALLEAVRERYGYSGGQYGDQFNRLKNADGSDQFSYEGLPDSVSQYQQQIQQLADQLLNQEPFSYDPYSDPLYNLYAQQYTSGGQSAMQNTLAQIAARTGGLASSYAGTAAQQAYNGYMSQLANKIPELYQLAYGMYRDRVNDQRENIGLLQGLSDSDYNRYANERNFAYQNYLSNRDYNYQVGRDRNDDYRFEAERADAQLDRDLKQRELAADILLNIASGGAGAAADGVDYQTFLSQGELNLPVIMQLLGL